MVRAWSLQIVCEADYRSVSLRGKAYLAKPLPPEVAVKSCDNDMLAVLVRCSHAEVLQIRKELSLIYGDDL